MADHEALCAVLTKENEVLRERILALEQALVGGIDAPAFLRLSGSEARLFGVLMARDSMTKDLAMLTLYGQKPDADVAGEKTVDVFICNLRRKLKPFGIEISTVWGQGYFIAAPMKEQARAMIAKGHA